MLAHEGQARARGIERRVVVGGAGRGEPARRPRGGVEPAHPAGAVGVGHREEQGAVVAGQRQVALDGVVVGQLLPRAVGEVQRPGVPLAVEGRDQVGRASVGSAGGVRDLHPRRERRARGHGARDGLELDQVRGGRHRACRQHRAARRAPRRVVQARAHRQSPLEARAQVQHVQVVEARGEAHHVAAREEQPAPRAVERRPAAAAQAAHQAPLAPLVVDAHQALLVVAAAAQEDPPVAVAQGEVPVLAVEGQAAARLDAPTKRLDTRAQVAQPLIVQLGPRVPVERPARVHVVKERHPPAIVAVVDRAHGGPSVSLGHPRQEGLPVQVGRLAPRGPDHGRAQVRQRERVPLERLRAQDGLEGPVAHASASAHPRLGQHRQPLDHPVGVQVPRLEGAAQHRVQYPPYARRVLELEHVGELVGQQRQAPVDVVCQLAAALGGVGVEHHQVVGQGQRQAVGRVVVVVEHHLDALAQGASEQHLERPNRRLARRRRPPGLGLQVGVGRRGARVGVVGEVHVEVGRGQRAPLARGILAPHQQRRRKQQQGRDHPAFVVSCRRAWMTRSPWSVSSLSKISSVRDSPFTRLMCPPVPTARVGNVISARMASMMPSTRPA